MAERSDAFQRERGAVLLTEATWFIARKDDQDDLRRVRELETSGAKEGTGEEEDHGISRATNRGLKIWLPFFTINSLFRIVYILDK